MSEDKPRYSRITDLLDLLFFIDSKPNGVTIEDIMERYNVSRRTAVRMKDALLFTEGYPLIEEVETSDRKKHWGINNLSLANLTHFSSSEIATLEQLQELVPMDGKRDEISNIINKIKSFNKKKVNNLEASLELIMQTEGCAVRQIPHYNIDLEKLNILRNAIKESRCVKAFYNNKDRKLEPLGLIYGEKVYLVARERAKDDGIFLFILHKFGNISITFERFDKEDFNLKEYTSRSFGVYQEDNLMNVKLWFSPKVAFDVLNYTFHPTQKIKQEEDGSVIVTFKACGSYEIIWHVVRWGKECKILAPKSLKKEFVDYVKRLLD